MRFKRTPLPHSQRESHMTPRRPILLYILLVGLPLVGVLGVLELGKKVTAPLPASGPWPQGTLGTIPAPPSAPNLVTLLLQVAAIVITARLVGVLFHLDYAHDQRPSAAPVG